MPALNPCDLVLVKCLYTPSFPSCSLVNLSNGTCLSQKVTDCYCHAVTVLYSNSIFVLISSAKMLHQCYNIKPVLYHWITTKWLVNLTHKIKSHAGTSYIQQFLLANNNPTYQDE
jgi:hypothetical protein